ncbi:hypothetical protein DSLASN_02900 [Desulfoluna limicola]|uniref:Tetratricopeptide repeat protein n=1 Tax=Desulfoluna limicola TaxID=2810562 RepID=A0ABM7PBX5_9BACT|nr:hypothetical protein DSLASN_02900 [Desulfoluna limicola]
MGLTIHRNQDWRTEETFWTDAIQKSPGIARPYHNLARDHYERVGDYETALKLYKTALNKRDLRPDHKAYSYNNIASLYYKMSEYDTALEYVENALRINHQYEVALYNKCLILISMGQMIEAETIVKLLMERYQSNLDYRALYGFVLMKMGRNNDAESQLGAVVDTNPYHLTALMHFGVLQGIMGNNVEAEQILIKLIKYSPSKLMSKICLLELYRSTDERTMKRYLAFILKTHELRDLKKAVEMSKNDHLAPLLDYDSLDAVLSP